MLGGVKKRSASGTHDSRESATPVGAEYVPVTHCPLEPDTTPAVQPQGKPLMTLVVVIAPVHVDDE